MFATPPAQPAVSLEHNLRVELRRERAENKALRTKARLLRRDRDRARRVTRLATSSPDAWVTFKLAGLAYGQDWQQLRACALSEGYRDAERYAVRNTRPNRGGSGAFGAFQFMRGTYLSTPQGRAGLDWARQDVQIMAAAWMWQAGRRGEWAGAGC